MEPIELNLGEAAAIIGLVVSVALSITFLFLFYMIVKWRKKKRMRKMHKKAK